MSLSLRRQDRKAIQSHQWKHGKRVCELVGRRSRTAEESGKSSYRTGSADPNLLEERVGDETQKQGEKDKR